VSDERDSADATGDGDDTGGRHSAVVTQQPARPTGKRTRQRTTEVEDAVEDDVREVAAGGSKNGSGKKAKTAKKSEPSRNPFTFVFTFMKQVVAELRKVIWPNRKQMVSYTTVVLVFLAFMVGLIGVVDLGLAKLVLLVFG
jgi:preprotein translocase subunit SecE